MISQLMEKAKSEIKEIESKISSIMKEMAELKTDLYGQFGENINLENEEEWLCVQQALS